MEKSTKLSTESYKGVRDFYPEDKFIQDYVFGVWKKTAESFGYVAYDASPLEPTELYKAKSGDEIINEQTYTFKDRGDREVTLRPEMTPTVARMIAGRRREMKFPQRWYSIPNCFRYERPQRGRLREHFQFNCDIFGVPGIEAEVELMKLICKVLENFGLKKEQYKIGINSRISIYKAIENLGVTGENIEKVRGLLDKKSKIKNFDEELEKITGNKNKFTIEQGDDVNRMLEKLSLDGIDNISFDNELVRGFDYYTGIVFEFTDTNPLNSRAICGGGRYDNLLEIFGEEKLPTVGFGFGDVTIRDVLETYGLLPEYKSPTDVAILPFTSALNSNSDTIANTLRKHNINVAVDYSDKKIGDKIGKADKEKIRYVIVVGENEIEENSYTLKELATKNESKGTIDELCDIIIDTK
jgi:histidyl-tRNA synthetase